MTDAEKIEALKANLTNLDEKGRTFADSLLAYRDKNDHLSRKQWYWVGRLAGLEEPKKKKKSKAKAKPDARFEAMLSAFQSANANNRKRIKRAIHPDLWEGATWATDLFQAVNK